MDANAFGLKDAPAHIQAMHKAILQRTGIDHAVNTLTIAFDSALEAYRVVKAPALCPSSVAGNIDPDFEDALDQIRNWPISRSYILLFEFIKHQVWRHSFGQLSASSVDDGAVEYTFTTGGWSENEEILEALKQQRLAWALTWQRSERGGKYVFRVSSVNQ